MSETWWCNGKRGICTCNAIACNDCKYYNETGSVELSESLLGYIRQLEAERDKAIECLRQDINHEFIYCNVCKYNGGDRCTHPDGAVCDVKTSNWEWQWPIPKPPKEG